MTPIIDASSAGGEYFPSGLPKGVRTGGFHAFSRLTCYPLYIYISMCLLLVAALMSVKVPIAARAPLTERSL